MKCKQLLVMLTVFLSLQSFAQEKKSITLNEAIDLGIRNSKQLKTSQAKIEEATAMLKEEKDKKLPNASVSGSYIRLNSAVIIVSYLKR